MANHADHFADQIRLLASLPEGHDSERVLDAFRNVPRENFAGPGPWLVRSPLWGGFVPRLTPDDDPRWLYHNVLVVLDEEKGINIGEPAMWARLLARTNVKSGANILQVGAGVGYYTAILKELAGASGSVAAYEVEEGLALQARANLQELDNVLVHHGNAATRLEGDKQFDLIVGFAGVTHIPIVWSDRLAPGGRALVPLTGSSGWGAMALLTATEDGFDAITLGRCGFYGCTGARDHRLAKEIDKLFFDARRLDGWEFGMEGVGENVRFRVE